MIAIAFLVLMLLLSVSVLMFVVMMPSPQVTTIDAYVTAHDLRGDDDTRRAVGRFIGRTRSFARRGMVLGLFAAVVLGVAWYQQITVGFGASPIGDLVTMGLGGWFVGLLLSARYWRRTVGEGPRTAPLTPRDTSRYRSPALARSMAAVAVLSGILSVAVVLPGDGTDRFAVAALGLISGSAIGWAARTQTRIARRPQPFVGTDLLAADEAMRITSAQTIGLAAIGVGLAVIGWQASFAIRAFVDASGPTWWGFLPMLPLVVGLVVASKARRLIHPRITMIGAPVEA